MSPLRCSLGLCAVICTVTALPAQKPDSVESVAVAPGVTHRHLLLNDGPWSVHVLEVDLKRPELFVKTAHADDRFRGREKVSSIAARSGTDTTIILGAINADFFNLATGENENNQVLGGEI